jgi:acetyl-CoA carboxylase carboxyl transferase subunit alpha
MIDLKQTLDFERPIIELENRIEELKLAGGTTIGDEVQRLEHKAERLQAEIFAELTPWQKVQLSRHPLRPYTLDYIHRLFTDFVELHGDRAFHDDAAIVAGLARLDGEPVMIIGHQKGRGTKENVRRNFGMPRPEGYRKALRLMKLAGRVGLPILTFIDTPGAYPGIDAEERGQAEAIAKNLEVMCQLPVPIITTVIGEGGSGGALAISIADRIFMLEYSVYSVISPEGCASILWKDQSKVAEAAKQLHMTASELVGFGIADRIIDEPIGGAHRNANLAAERVHGALSAELAILRKLTPARLLDQRYAKFRKMGPFIEVK